MPLLRLPKQFRQVQIQRLGKFEQGKERRSGTTPFEMPNTRTAHSGHYGKRLLGPANALSFRLEQLNDLPCRIRVRVLHTPKSIGLNGKYAQS